MIERRRAARSTSRGARSRCDGEPVQLTYVEFELLRTLARPAGPRLHAPGAARGALGRLRLPRAAHDRRPHPAPAREARARPARAGADPHGARRRLPLPGPVTALLRSVGARLALALAGRGRRGARASSISCVVPLLQRHLVKAQARRSSRGRARRVRSLAGREQLASARRIRLSCSACGRCGAPTNARVVALSAPPAPSRLSLLGDSHGRRHHRRPARPRSRSRAARRARTASSGRGDRDGQRYAEVAVPVGRRGVVAALVAPLHDTLANVAARRAAPADRGRPRGAAARRGRSATGARRSFTRRIAAAASGPPTASPTAQFDEPVVDSGGTSSAQLARTFERMRQRLAHARPRAPRVHRQRLARAADAAVLARRLPRAARPTRSSTRARAASSSPR